jgi:hypothetical protein
MRPVWNIARLRERAPGRSSIGTRRGMRAWRDGLSKAPAAAPNAFKRYKATSVSQRATVRAASPTATNVITDCATSMTFRRSRRSAITPPQRENRTVGRARVRPTKPRANGEPVRR